MSFVVQQPQQTMYVPIQANQRGNPRGTFPTSNMSAQPQQGGQPQATFQPSQMAMTAPPFIPSSHHQPQQGGQFMMTPQMMMPQQNVVCNVDTEPKVFFWPQRVSLNL